MLVAYTYNPSYSGGRDEGDQDLKPFVRPCLKKPFTKKGRVAQGVGPKFKPQCCKKEKKQESGWGRRRNRE
jgi:hypothetical protein